MLTCNTEGEVQMCGYEGSAEVQQWSAEDREMEVVGKRLATPHSGTHQHDVYGPPRGEKPL